MGNDHTDRNVYILGAGFSAEAGAPLINDFLDQSRQLLDMPFGALDDRDKAHFRRVFGFRRDMAQAREKIDLDLDDIEQLFGLVEISHRLQGSSSQTRNSTVYLIVKTLQILIQQHVLKRIQLVVPYKEEYKDSIPRPGTRLPVSTGTGYFAIDPYDFFVGLVKGAFDDPGRRHLRKDTIITFNYDLVCEDALERFGARANYALDLTHLEDHRDRKEGESIDLLKLHGSANWGVCATCNRRVVVLSQKVTDSPAEFQALHCPHCKKTGHFVPLLVPPSWDKSGYAEIVGPVWNRAIEELKAATRICIIGYSLPETDSFFKYLLATALAGNHQLYKLIVVDYAGAQNDAAARDVAVARCAKVKAQYERLLDELFQERRFKFFDSGFPGFLAAEESRKTLGRCEKLGNGGFGGTKLPVG